MKDMLKYLIKTLAHSVFQFACFLALLWSACFTSGSLTGISWARLLGMSLAFFGALSQRIPGAVLVASILIASPQSV